MMTVTDKRYDRHVQQLAQPSERIWQHRHSPAEGISRLGIDDGDIPIGYDPLKLTYQYKIAGEFAFADASDVPEQLFSADKSVYSDYIIRAVRIYRCGGRHDIHKSVMVAEKEIRGLYALHPCFRQLLPVTHEHWLADKIGDRLQIPFRPHRN